MMWTDALRRAPASVNWRWSPMLLAVAPFMLGLLFGWIWTGGERILSHDSFYYLRLTKLFADSPPKAFGSFWPYGYSFTGAVVSYLGFSAHSSLLLISAFSLLAMFGLSAKILTTDGVTWTMVALLLVPAINITIWSLVWNPMTELGCAALILVMAYFMADWPRRDAVLISVLAAIGAFLFRYAGVFAFGVLVWWTVVQIVSTEDKKTRVFTIACVVTGIVFGLLIWAGIVTSPPSDDVPLAGRFAARPGVMRTIYVLANLGWSIVTLLVADRTRRIVDTNAPLGLLVGWALIAMFFALVVRSYLKPKSKYSKPLSLVTGIYIPSMVFFAVITSGATQGSARAFVPVLFPSLIIVLEQLGSRFSRTLLIGAGLLVAIGTFSAVRGRSPELSGDIRQLREVLSERINDSDTVAVTSQALALAAYFDNPFVWVSEPGQSSQVDFLAVAAQRHRQGGSLTFEFSPPLREIIRDAEESGEFAIIHQDDGAVLLEKIRRHKQRSISVGQGEHPLLSIAATKRPPASP